jgi:phosphate transport system protein
MGKLHTDREYEAELSSLRERLLYMAARVEEQLVGALSAYERLDVPLARRMSQADSQIDKLELEIDGLCIQLLARRQPVASDLRFVTTSLKVVTDLERIGDLATNICERVVELEGTPVGLRPTVINEMGRAARNMLRDAMDAFVDGDAKKAQEVVARDETVDEQYRALFPVIAERMASSTSNLDCLMRTLSISKYIERIADHATNLAEMVVFMVDGRDVRHTHPSGERNDPKDRLN